MSGALQAVFQNQRSFIVVPVVGSALGGGYFAGQISTAGNGIADFNLVVGPKASAQVVKQWKTAGGLISGANSDIDGIQNTADIVAAGNATTFPAGHFCNNLVVGGFTDWYLPAKNEIEICYYNLKPETSSNRTNSGINPNAVPPRASNYTAAGAPLKTSAVDFQETGGVGGPEAFGTQAPNRDYWSSTQYAPSPTNNVSTERFYDGWQYYNGKSSYLKLRAVRRVAV